MTPTSPVKIRNLATTLGVWVAAIAAVLTAGAATTAADKADAMPSAFNAVTKHEGVQGSICLTYTDFVLDQHHQNGLSAEQVQAAVEHAFDAPAGDGGADEDASIDTMCGTPAEVLEATG